MKKSRRTYNGVHLNKKSNTQDVVEQSLTKNHNTLAYIKCKFKGAYFIRSMLLLTKLFKASPFNIPFCSSAKSIS